MILRPLAWLGLLSLCAAAPAPIVMRPPGDSVGFRAYALGFIPVDGRFIHFTGTLSFDDPGCHLTLTAEAGSLELSNPDRTRQVVGPEFLDAPRFPALSYTGTCSDGHVIGVLTLHGVSRPLTLKITADPDVFRAEGEALRADWGITAEPIKIGAHLRLSVDVRLPRP